MENKKILFVIDTYDTSNNGTSISAQRYASELRRRGHEVKILTAGEPGEDKFVVPNFTMPIFQPLMDKHNFDFAKFWGEEALSVIKQAVEWSDIVHCFLPFALETTAQRYAIKIGKPCTGAFHMQPENMTSSVGMGKVDWFNELFYNEFRRNMYDRFHHVHCVSEFMANTIRERGYKAKLHVISNGIQDDFIEAGKRKGERLKVKGERKEDNLIKIMMIGRLSREKRQDVIIDAVKYSKYGDKIQLVFAGKGPEYERYLEMGKALKHEPRFIYVGKEELIKELLETDLYVHASDMESEAISCIEAFATGLVPVIANSDNSATPQFALDGRSLFMPGNPKDLARAIDYWIEHPEERIQMGRRYAEEAKKYTLAEVVTKFEEMLNEEIHDHETVPHIIAAPRRHESIGYKIRHFAALL